MAKDEERRNWSTEKLDPSSFWQRHGPHVTFETLVAALDVERQQHAAIGSLLPFARLNHPTEQLVPD